MNKMSRGCMLRAFAARFSALRARYRATGGSSRPGAPNAVPLRAKFSRIPCPYCVFLPPSYDSDKARKFPVLYFLHGLGENAQTLLNAGGWNLIENLWEQKQIGEFLIVTPSADRSFYINSLDGKVRYEDFFIREFLPFIESHYRIQADRHDRGITGISMGGYGALRFAFRYPQLFGSVSAHSAALVAKLPAVQASSPQARRARARDGRGVRHALRPRILEPQQSLHAGGKWRAPDGHENLFRLRNRRPIRFRRRRAGISRSARREENSRTNFISIPADTTGSISPSIFPPRLNFTRGPSA